MVKRRKIYCLKKSQLIRFERQLKDTQYISIAVKNELAKIVGSDHVKTSTGEVTSFLRSRWGLKNFLWNLRKSV
jgi:CRISPR/Cas system Type II protein with McrA/HNH and RuvC-like nuclease domain